jgi:hypothetical protein
MIEMKMINIINQNKAKKQQSIRREVIKKQAKKEKISNILTIVGYLAATCVIIEIVTLLVK